MIGVTTNPLNVPRPCGTCLRCRCKAHDCMACVHDACSCIPLGIAGHFPDLPPRRVLPLGAGVRVPDRRLEPERKRSHVERQIIGERFERLLALSIHRTDSATSSPLYVCQCDCRRKRTTSSKQLLNGSVRSCGRCFEVWAA